MHFADGPSAVVIVMASAWGVARKKRRTRNSKCGKWRVDVISAVNACNACAENLESNAKDLNLENLESLCASTATRAASCRYRDPPEIKNLIAGRRELHGVHAKNASNSYFARAKASEGCLAARPFASGCWRQLSRCKLFSEKRTSECPDAGLCHASGGFSANAPRPSGVLPSKIHARRCTCSGRGHGFVFGTRRTSFGVRSLFL